VKDVESAPQSATVAVAPVIEEGSTCNEDAREVESGINCEAKIVIIDDNVQDQKLMQRILSQKGYHHFFFSETGEAGIELVEKTMPDIVLVDTQLPGMNGFETCRTIKDKHGDQIKVIVVTGAIDAIDATEARESGTDSYCAKTRDCMNLCESIKKLLSET
ncbi:response regulator, partial [Candidatus Omnitrophota bacterium]